MERMGLRNHPEALRSPWRSASETSGLDASWNRQENARDTVLQRKKHADAAAADGTRPFSFLIAASLRNGTGCRSCGGEENSLIKCHIDYVTFVFSFESWKQWIKDFEVLAGPWSFKTDVYTTAPNVWPSCYSNCLLTLLTTVVSAHTRLSTVSWMYHRDFEPALLPRRTTLPQVVLDERSSLFLQVGSKVTYPESLHLAITLPSCYILPPSLRVVVTA